MDGIFLATTLKNSNMEWKDRSSVKKGNIGEEIVKKSLEDKGYVIYGSITDKAHAFDFLAIKDKRVFVIAEVKSKARMNKYECTGIDIRHFNEYMYIYENQHIDVILFFVDEHPKMENVYCQRLSELIKPKLIGGISYPCTTLAMGKVMFSLSNMVTVCKLTSDQVAELKTHSNRSYEYV